MVFLNRVLTESYQVLLSPKKFFANIQKTDYMYPIMKSVMYGLTAGLIIFIYTMLGVTPRMPFGTMFLLVLVFFPLANIIGLFISALILMILSWMCCGSTLYKETVNISAAMLVIVPLNAVLSVFAQMNIYAGLTLNIIIYIFSLWILFAALTVGLSGNPVRSKVVISVLFVIFVSIFVLSLTALRTAQRVLQESGINMEQLKDLQKNPEEAQERIKEIMEKYLEKKD